MENRVDYRIRVDDGEQMAVWRVAAGDVGEAEHLGPGEYLFTRISYPLEFHGRGDWIVLKGEYRSGVIIGRGIASINPEQARKEGFTIEEVATATERRRKEKVEATTR